MMSAAVFDPPVPIGAGCSVSAIRHGEMRCHLVIRGARSLLINCVEGLTPAGIRHAGLPVPSEIWHTQVDGLLAAEGSDFEAARVRLPRLFAGVASDSDEYRTAAGATWENPERWMEDLGHQPYGVAGSVILRPPARLLAGFDTFECGDVLVWEGLAFEVLDFGVRNFYAVGFALREGGRVAALFGGDLAHGDGSLPDAHGFEVNYSAPPWGRISETIGRAASLGPDWLFSSRGESSPRAAELLRQLAERIADFARPAGPSAPLHASGSPAAFGRYHDHGDLVFQMSVNFGNVILLIDSCGSGLLVDPGPCDFENPGRTGDFLRDLERFEAQAGLKKIDLVLVTHFHGDHLDMWPVVRERYPGCRLAAWRPVADVIRHPEYYSYACMLRWYGLGWTGCEVDVDLARNEPLDWHGHPIHTVHLPGHCLVHAGYWIDWRGRRILFSGDSIQTRGVPDGLQLLMSNHSVPGTGEGHAAAYRSALPLGITLNLGGHGSHFGNCAEIYRASLENIERTTSRLLGLFGGRSPEGIFVREHMLDAAAKVRALMAGS